MDKRLFALFIVSAMILSACTLSMLPEQLQERIVEANSNIQSYEIDMIYSMQMSMDMFGESIETDSTVVMQGKVDLDNQKMYMASTMEDEMFGEIETEMYIIDNKMYSKSFGSWMELDFDDDIWKQNARMEESLDYLASGKVEILKSEDIDGEAHYVVKVEPDLSVLAQYGATEELDMEDIDYEELFEEYSITFWVNKNSYIISKMTVDFTMVEEGFEMGISMAVSYSNINEELEITLPEEAMDAPNLEDELEDMLADLDMDDLEDFEYLDDVPEEDEEPQTAEDCAAMDGLVDRNVCYWSVAVDTNDIELCLKIEGEVEITTAINCFHDVDENIGLSTQQVIDSCNELPERLYHRNSCFHNMAQWRQEPGLCDYASMLKDTCVEYATS